MRNAPYGFISGARWPWRATIGSTRAHAVYGKHLCARRDRITRNPPHRPRQSVEPAREHQNRGAALACATGLAAERHGPGARPVHVGPHVVRVEHPARQGRDVDRGPLLRGLLRLRQAAAVARVDPGRGGLHAVHRARGAGAAQVPRELPPVPHLSRAHGRHEARGHHALVLAGGDGLRAVLHGLGAPLHHADAPGPHRAVRVGRPRVDRPDVAAVPRDAVRGRVPRRHRPVPPRAQVGLVRRAPTRSPPAAGCAPSSGR